MKVFLDAGHGGKDPGACANGLIEKHMTLITAKAAAMVLEKSGIEVMLSRTGDKALGLSERADMANRWGADLFVSCHYNAGGGDYGLVLHSVYGGRGKLLAEKVRLSIAALGQNDTRLSAKTATCGSGDYFTVISKTNMPAIIVEPCFIDSADRELADTEDEQWNIGIAIAEGVLAFLGMVIKKPEAEVTSVNDVVYELSCRGIISATDLWFEKLEQDKNSYWLARKTVEYIRKAGV